MRFPTDRGVIAAADLTGGTVECVQLVDNGSRKLRLEIRKDGVIVEACLSAAEAADFAEDLLRVLDWLAD